MLHLKKASYVNNKKSMLCLGERKSISLRLKYLWVHLILENLQYDDAVVDNATKISYLEVDVVG